MLTVDKNGFTPQDQQFTSYETNGTTIVSSWHGWWKKIVVLSKTSFCIRSCGYAMACPQRHCRFSADTVGSAPCAHAVRRLNRGKLPSPHLSAFRFLPNLHTADRWQCVPGRHPPLSVFSCRPIHHRNNAAFTLASSRREPVFQQATSFIYLIKSLVYKIVVIVNAAVNCG